MAEAVAKGFAGKIALGTLKFEANELEAVRLTAAEALDSKRETLIGMIGNRQDAPRQIVILRPQMQEGFLRAAAHFPRKPGERSYTAAILANFYRAVVSELLERGLQFGEEVHAKEYKGNN